MYQWISVTIRFDAQILMIIRWWRRGLTLGHDGISKFFKQHDNNQEILYTLVTRAESPYCALSRSLAMAGDFAKMATSMLVL
jgi:hypothetical protein